MTLSREELEALRALALKATPGPWAWQSFGDWCLTGQWGMRPIVLAGGRTKVSLRLRDNAKQLLVPFTPDHPDAAFIAACDPQTILALIDRAEQHDAQAAETIRGLQARLEGTEQELAAGALCWGAYNEGILDLYRRTKARLEAAERANRDMLPAETQRALEHRADVAEARAAKLADALGQTKAALDDAGNLLTRVTMSEAEYNSVWDALQFAKRCALSAALAEEGA